MRATRDETLDSAHTRLDKHLYERLFLGPATDGGRKLPGETT
jgi:hypothetical protein